ncbi:MAG: VOC family protein [Fimbriimonadaceae bacterium]|nr:VOC family protein [Fimbriimonadaceae bacterium]QYK56242.1 MAG: VOC family protein [Fimbriimonadaceae bacterium]
MAQLDAIGIVVKDMAESVRFYRLLGVAFPEPAEDHLEATMPNGLRIMLDSVEMVKSFKPWVEPVGNRMNLAFLCEDAEEVDRLYRKVTEAGFTGDKEPWDAFWGQRYAQVADPDGNVVDLFAPL